MIHPEIQLMHLEQTSWAPTTMSIGSHIFRITLPTIFYRFYENLIYGRRGDANQGEGFCLSKVRGF